MLSGLSRSTIFQLIKQNKFPNSVKLSGRAVGWKKSEFDDWCQRESKQPYLAINKGLHGHEQAMPNGNLQVLKVVVMAISTTAG